MATGESEDTNLFEEYKIQLQKNQLFQKNVPGDDNLTHAAEEVVFTHHSVKHISFSPKNVVLNYFC